MGDCGELPLVPELQVDNEDDWSTPQQMMGCEVPAPAKVPANDAHELELRKINKKLRQAALLEAKGPENLDEEQRNKVAQRHIFESERAAILALCNVLDETQPMQLPKGPEPVSLNRSEEAQIAMEPVPRYDFAEVKKIEKKLRQISALEAKGLHELDAEQLRKVGCRRALEKTLARMKSQSKY